MVVSAYREPAGDGPPPVCEWAFCERPACYRRADADGVLRYVCAEHRPFTKLAGRAR